METIIEKYIALQKEILANFSERWDVEKCKTTFLGDVKKYYGFEKEFYWNIMLNAYYVINDTELAKASFEKFDLQGPSRHRDIGERYLRLYGILNAAYQQKIAIENLMEIFKLPQKTKFTNHLNSNELITLRNKIGAHPSNYKNDNIDSVHKFDVYEISRPDLANDRITLLENQHLPEKYNLTNTIKEFDSLIENILCLLTGKIIKKLLNNQGDFYEKYLIINKIKNGEMIFRNSSIIFNDFNL